MEFINKIIMESKNIWSEEYEKQVINTLNCNLNSRSRQDYHILKYLILINFYFKVYMIIKDVQNKKIRLGRKGLD